MMCMLAQVSRPIRSGSSCAIELLHLADPAIVDRLLAPSLPVFFSGAGESLFFLFVRLLDLQIEAKCPFLLHLVHLLSAAGQRSRRPCSVPHFPQGLGFAFGAGAALMLVVALTLYPPSDGRHPFLYFDEISLSNLLAAVASEFRHSS